jgi:nitrogen fixation protein NifQ
MLASQVAGMGAMPERLGLTTKQFGALMGIHFPGVEPVLFDSGPELDIERAQERDELRKLFLAYCPNATAEQVWVADMLAAGCMGGNHLWQDLGVWSRKDVSTLVENNFPALKAKNDRDMKWKKFFYKQLCNQEGIYTCRSPSCEVCADYKSCFGPEEL